MSEPLLPILSRFEFSRPELDALRLDGEVFRLDECAIPIDEVAGPHLRAAVLAIELPVRLIAERHSAAWVWGAQLFPPARHEVCADTSARTRPPAAAHLDVREVVLLREDVTTLAGVSLTTPLRTAIDLCRFVTEWSEIESATISGLMRIGRFDAADCIRVMDRRRNLPKKKQARLRLALADQERARQG
jgi:hypothetical protein